jgi:hypothetical protein
MMSKKEDEKTKNKKGQAPSSQTPKIPIPIPYVQNMILYCTTG